MTNVGELLVGLPGFGEVGAWGGVVAEAGVNAGAELDEAAEEPEEIGEAVEIGEDLFGDLRLAFSAGFGEGYGDALGAAADGTGDLIRGGLGVGSGEGPVGEDAFGGLDLVDEFGEVGNVFGNDEGLGGVGGGWCGEGCAYGEELALDLLGPGGDVGLGAEAAGEAEEGVELVDGSVGVYTEVGFGEAEAAGEGGGAGVSVGGCDGHGGAPLGVVAERFVFAIRVAGGPAGWGIVWVGLMR